MGGGECLDAMRERVEPGAGGNESGHADRQFRIADDHRRQDLRMKDNFFHARFGIDDHRRPTDFRTGTSGCGNRDNRRDYIGVGARPPVANVFKIPYWTRLSRHERHHLAQVHTGPPAKSDDAVVAACLVGGDAGVEALFVRIRIDFAKQITAQPRRFQNIERPGP